MKTDAEINAILQQQRAEIAGFIARHKEELFAAALRFYKTTEIPEGMFHVLEAYCIEFYGRENAFANAMSHIAEAALLECTARRPDTVKSEC